MTRSRVQSLACPARQGEVGRGKTEGAKRFNSFARVLRGHREAMPAAGNPGTMVRFHPYPLLHGLTYGLTGAHPPR